jgi:hypothetical protein
MPTARPAWLHGKRIAKVEMRAFDNGRGQLTYDPVLHFNDGSMLYFIVEETESQNYGIRPMYRPKQRG